MIQDNTYLEFMKYKTMEEENDVPKWANFICPSCAVSYGVNALVKAIKKRKERKALQTVEK